MLQYSDKENICMQRLDSRQVTFHFCEKYAKKRERRVKTEIADSQPRMICGSKMTLIAKGRPLLESKRNHQNSRKLSNFEILKRKISYLETEQFLGDRSHQPEGDCYPEIDYLVTGEFAHSKRITLLEKYRQNIKNLHNQKRKTSLNLLTKPAPESSARVALPLPQASDPDHADWLVKKRGIASQCAKRYFRPQSFKRNKEGSRFMESVAEIKGHRVQQSSRGLSGTGRCHRSTINFN